MTGAGTQPPEKDPGSAGEQRGSDAPLPAWKRRGGAPNPFPGATPRPSRPARQVEEGTEPPPPPRPGEEPPAPAPASPRDDPTTTFRPPDEDEVEVEHTLVSATGEDEDDGIERKMVERPADDGIERTIVDTGAGSPPEPEEPAALAGGTGIEHTLVQPSSVSDTTMLPSAAAMGGFPTIPGVQITREIGRGGMGVVYEGKQGYLDRRVAVKLLAGSQSGDFTKRFQREAKILAALSHPNVVSCYQAGVAPDGSCYLAMEFIDGPDLAQWIEKHGPLEPQRAADVCRAVASALAYAHRAGVIHRDVKPANVLLKPEIGPPPGAPFPYQPMLADLGLARATSSDVPSAVDLTMQGLTVQGTVMGSPPTMAPEQFNDPDSVDYRADVYGLGCVLFQCLTGKVAFPQTSLTSLIARKVRSDAPDPRDLRSDVPPKLADLVADMLSHAADDRPSYEELVERLAGPFEPAPRRQRALPSKALLGGALAVLLLGGGAWVAMGVLGDGEPEPGGDPAAVDVARAPDDPDEGGGPSAPDGSGEPGGAGTGETGASLAGALGAGRPPAGDGGAPGGTTSEASGAGDSAPPLQPADGDDAGATPPDAGPSDGPGAGGAGAGGPGGAEEGAAAGPGAGSEAEPPADEDGGASAADPSTGPGPAWPELAPIGAGETWRLLAANYGERPFEAWRVLAGETDAWSALEDSTNGAQALFVDGISSAERDLPAAPWTLTGELEILRPTYGSTRRLAVVVGFAAGGGVSLEQSVDAEDDSGGARFALRLVERADGDAGSWVPREGEGSSELESVVLAPAEYKSGSPWGFRVAWDGERLAIGYDAGAAFDARLDPADHGLSGPPVVLAVELEDGMAVLRDFELAGR